MSGRPWLEALKRGVAEEAPRAPALPSEEPTDAPGGELSKPPELSRREPGEARNVTEISTPRAGFARGEDERRLLTAGWSPKERCEMTLWENPDTGFYCSQEVALIRLGKRREGARDSGTKRSDPKKRGRHGLWGGCHERQDGKP